MIDLKRKWLSLLCALLIIFTPVCSSFAQEAPQAGQPLDIDFSLSASLNSEAMSEKPSRFMRDLAKLLDTLKLEGQATVLDRQIKADAGMIINSDPVVTLHLQGTPENLDLSTNLFGEEPVVLTMSSYIPVLLKYYYYFGIPFQYIGVVTDPYSYCHAYLPLRQEWESLFAGEGSRSYSPEECIQMAQQFSQSSSENEVLSFWLKGLLQHFGEDETALYFLSALPEWVEGCTENGGLEIEQTEEGETWTLGEDVVYSYSCLKDETNWQVTLPAWEGYQFTMNAVQTQNEEGIDLNIQGMVSVEDEPYAYLSFTGENLPDGKRQQGTGTATVHIGGEMIGFEETVNLNLSWDNRDSESWMETVLTWENPDTDKTALTMTGRFSWKPSTEVFEAFEVNANGDAFNFFCANDQTLKDFLSKSKVSILRTALPIVLQLPAGFINGAVDWLSESGILATMAEGISEE